MKNSKALDTFNLFPNLSLQPQTKKPDIIIRDEVNIAEYPIAILSKNKTILKVTIYPDTNREWTLVGSEEVGGVPCANDLDYWYALMSILYDQTKYQDNTIYFTIGELIARAGKKKNKQEYIRAIEAMQKFRWLIIRSKTYKAVDKGNDGGNSTKLLSEDISLLQHYAIVGGLKRGRKKALEESQDGYCMIVFSDYFIANLQSQELSKNLNFTFMMKLSTPLARRYFRLIDLWRHNEIKDAEGIVEKNIFDISKLLPLSNYKFPRQIQRLLSPVHGELIALRYLKDVSYTGKRGEVACYYFSNYSVEQAVALDDLVRKGVSQVVAQNLIVSYPTEFILDVIEYCKLKAKTQTVSPGYIVRTIQEATHESVKSFIEQQHASERKEKLQKEFTEKNKLRMFYEQDIESQALKAINSLPEEERKELENKARESLSKFFLKINGEPKKVAIEGAMISIVKKKFEIPSFDDWYKANHHRF